jgi:hypothetical protein
MHALIDNHNLKSKLALRQRFLRKYHAGSRVSVLDCCEGSGRIWRYLRKEFPCDVMGVDLKPAKGRLRLDSRRILELDWLSFDVVDIDTYGSPWRHWLNLLESLTQPATVFLTWGAVRRGQGACDHAMLEALGLKFPTIRMPGALATKISADLPKRMIALAWERGHNIVEAAEALKAGPSVRYFAVRIEPATQGTGG